MRLRDAGMLAILAAATLPGCGFPEPGPKTLEAASRPGQLVPTTIHASNKDLYNALNEGLTTLRGIVNPKVTIHDDDSSSIRAEASRKLEALQKTLINTSLGSGVSLYDTDLRDLFIKVSAIREMLDDNALSSPEGRSRTNSAIDGNTGIVYEAMGTSVWLMAKLAQ